MSDRFFSVRFSGGRRQSGASIFAAIFLLLLFSALAAFMVSFFSSANVASAQDVAGARAYQAAQAGVEWGLFQLDADDASANLPACFAATTLNQIPGHAVSVTCTPFPGAAAAPYDEGGRSIRIYRIVATATTAGPGGVAVERELVASIEKCRDPSISVAPFGC